MAGAVGTTLSGALTAYGRLTERDCLDPELAARAGADSFVVSHHLHPPAATPASGSTTTPARRKSSFARIRSGSRP